MSEPSFPFFFFFLFLSLDPERPRKKNRRHPRTEAPLPLPPLPPSLARTRAGHDPLLLRARSIPSDPGATSGSAIGRQRERAVRLSGSSAPRDALIK